MRQLIKPRKDATKMLDLVDEAFHQVPFPVPPAIVVAGLFAPLVRWDDHLCTTLTYQGDDGLPSISPIRNHARKRQSCQQRWRMWAVMALACRQVQTQRVAQAIDQHVDLGAESTTAPSQCLLIRRAVFFQRPQHTHAHGQSCYPRCRVPCRGHRQSEQACASIRPGHTTARSVCTPYSSCHTPQAVSAIVRHCGRSTARLPQNGDTPARQRQRRHGRQFAKTRESSSIGRPSNVWLSSANRISY